MEPQAYSLLLECVTEGPQSAAPNSGNQTLARLSEGASSSASLIGAASWKMLIDKAVA